MVIVKTTFNEEVKFVAARWQRNAATGSLEIYNENGLIADFQKDSWLFVHKVDDPNS